MFSIRKCFAVFVLTQSHYLSTFGHKYDFTPFQHYEFDLNNLNLLRQKIVKKQNKKNTRFDTVDTIK